MAQTYTYRPSPVLDKSFLIFLKDAEGYLQPVGDYTVLDSEEDRSLSEKKVMNLVSLLNGSEQLIYIGHESGGKTLFHEKPKADDHDPQQIIFYVHKGEGVSKENAILTMQTEFMK